MNLFIVTLAFLAAAQVLSEPGAQAMREGRFGDAERIYRQMLNESPGDARLHMNLGLALHSAGKYYEAIPELELFLKSNPAPGPLYLLAGVARLKLGQPCDAIPALEKARRWKADSKVLTELGDAYYGCKRFLQAGNCYREAAHLAPGNPALTRAGARAFWQAREYMAAKLLFAAAESGYANDAEFLYEFGDTVTRVEGAGVGLRYLEKAAKADPKLAPARGALGRALLELGRAAESIPHLEAAAPTDPALLLPLSRAYKATGRTEDAVRAEAEYRKRLLQN